MQAREDLVSAKRSSDLALATAAARQNELDQWKSQSDPDALIKTATNDLKLPAPVSKADQVSHTNEHGGDVAAIVSKWRCVSMQHVSEANGLAEQLAVERKALQNMRSHALMLERQVETAEDQLDSERSSYATRESSMRTQLQNLEAQVAEQERLISLKASAVAEAEAQAEKSSAEVIQTRERVRVLEDMVKSTEVELQTAIFQMSNMQDMVMATDSKLLEASEAMADRNDAIPIIQRMLEMLCTLTGVSCDHEDASATATATASVTDAERLMKTLQGILSEKDATIMLEVNKRHSLEQAVQSLKNQICNDEKELSVQHCAALEQQVTLEEVCRRALADQSCPIACLVFVVVEMECNARQ